jgi:hypothetical protein
VENASILNVGVPADPDKVHVAANYGVEPDARVIANLNVTDDLRSLRHEHALTQSRPLSAIFQQHRSTLAERRRGIQGREVTREI